jgi:hypothetical protein
MYSMLSMVIKSLRRRTDLTMESMETMEEAAP